MPLRRKKSLGTKENVEVIGNSILIGKQGIKLYSSLKKNWRKMNRMKKWFSLNLKYLSALNDPHWGDIP